MKEESKVVGKLTCRDIYDDTVKAVNIMYVDCTFYNHLDFIEENGDVKGYCFADTVGKVCRVVDCLEPIIATFDYKEEILNYVSTLIDNGITVTFKRKNV